jgi:hypothetical protein
MLRQCNNCNCKPVTVRLPVGSAIYCSSVFIVESIFTFQCGWDLRVLRGLHFGGTASLFRSICENRSSPLLSVGQITAYILLAEVWYVMI